MVNALRPSAPGAPPAGAPRPRARAFTLVELLVVIAVIALLAGLALSSVKLAKERASIGRTTANMKQLTAALLLYTGDNDGRLPGTTDLGLQPAVSDVYVGSAGTGGWSDWRSRLGYYLAPYCGIPAGTKQRLPIPCFSEPYWVAAMKSQRASLMTESMRHWAVSYTVNPRFRRADFPQLSEDFEPFGGAGDNGGANGAPNGKTPSTMGEVGARLPTAQAWWLCQADQELYKFANLDKFALNASLPQPLYARNRVAAFFDGSVRLVPVGADMRKPL